MRGGWLLGVWVVLAGCELFSSSSSPDPPDDGIDDDPPITAPDGKTGFRGRGQFLYTCIGDRDPACLSSYALLFPELIALGGRFNMQYLEDPESARYLSVYSGAPERISYNAGFMADATGLTAMLAYEDPGSDAKVIDFVTLDVVAPVSLRMRRVEEEVAVVELEVGDEAVLTALSLDEFGNELAGTLTFDWTLGPEAVGELLEVLPGGVRVKALKPGETVVTARLGELSVAVDVVVGGVVETTGEPTGTGATGETGSDGTSGEGGTTSSSGTTSPGGTTGGLLEEAP
mgnify:CR=1 FL=1